MEESDVMTLKLYLDNSYLKDTTAVITEQGDDYLQFDRTIFYPVGGGQPSDRGHVEIDGKTYQIVDAKKNGSEVKHFTAEEIEGDVSGKIAKLFIDWERRYTHMKYHTAIHIIDAVVHLLGNPDMLITGSQIYEDRARIDFDFEKLDRDTASDLVKRANEVIKEAHPIVVREISRDEALSIEGLARTEPGRKLIMSLEKVRVVEIQGLDMQADGGTHVRNTSEIGKINLGKVQSKGKHNKRMEIRIS